MAELFKGGQVPTLFPMMKAGSEDAATCIFSVSYTHLTLPTIYSV